MGLQVHTAIPNFYVGAGDPKSVPNLCITRFSHRAASLAPDNNECPIEEEFVALRRKCRKTASSRLKGEDLFEKIILETICKALPGILKHSNQIT